MKQCVGCLQLKSQKEFYPSSWKKQDYRCKSCSVKRGREQRKSRLLANYWSERFKYAKNVAKTTKKPFLLTQEEYEAIASKPCFYCNSEPAGLGVGLDRIDNDKSIGYRKDNVLPCCVTCNKIRGNSLTVQETKVAIDAVLKYRKTEL